MVFQYSVFSGKNSGREDKDLAMTIGLISYRLLRLLFEEFKKTCQGKQARAAAECVLRHHAWQNRLQQITEMAV